MHLRSEYLELTHQSVCTIRNRSSAHGWSRSGRSTPRQYPRTRRRKSSPVSWRIITLVCLRTLSSTLARTQFDTTCSNAASREVLPYGRIRASYGGPARWRVPASRGRRLRPSCRHACARKHPQAPPCRTGHLHEQGAANGASQGAERAYTGAYLHPESSQQRVEKLWNVDAGLRVGGQDEVAWDGDQAEYGRAYGWVDVRWLNYPRCCMIFWIAFGMQLLCRRWLSLHGQRFD